MPFDDNLKLKRYFENRKIDPIFYKDYYIPSYLLKVLPKETNATILDIGCGFGQIISALQKLGYNQVCGVDISEEAVSFCIENQLNVLEINDIIEFANSDNHIRYDFIIMSHVLEHIDKNNIIPTLAAIKHNLLTNIGEIVIMVPNAQSNTGCYWAYEDFTHTTLFTAGSLYYVLKAAGFETITFLDPYCLEDLSLIKKLVKKFFLRLYAINIDFWNRITSSSFHKPSPQIFSFEIKALVKNESPV